MYISQDAKSLIKKKYAQGFQVKIVEDLIGLNFSPQNFIDGKSVWWSDWT